MRKHTELFERVRRRPGMYFEEDNYEVAAAFVLGYDMACEGGILIGFREWLVARVGRGSNLVWSALVLEAAFPAARDPQAEAVSNMENQRKAIGVMWDLLAEFEAARQEPDGLRAIFAAYEQWEQEQARADTEDGRDTAGLVRP